MWFKKKIEYRFWGFMLMDNCCTICIFGEVHGKSKISKNIEEELREYYF